MEVVVNRYFLSKETRDKHEFFDQYYRHYKFGESRPSGGTENIVARWGGEHETLKDPHQCTREA